jgi:hypothetical protein
VRRKRLSAAPCSGGRGLEGAPAADGEVCVLDLNALTIEQRRIRAGRPETNGHVERLQQTTLEGCWRPAFARSLVPKLTALERDLTQYLTYYNFDRAHTGRLTKGRIPGQIVYGARKMPTTR